MIASHYKNRCLYLEDAAETNKPWERWECLSWPNDEWKPLLKEPTWNKNNGYRRIDQYRDYKEALAESKTIQLLWHQTWSDIHGEPSFAQPPECYRVKPEPESEEKTSINIDIVTKVKGAFKIEQEVSSGREKLFNATLDTSEKHIRDALIELGWTPPEGDDV